MEYLIIGNLSTHSNNCARNYKKTRAHYTVLNLIYTSYLLERRIPVSAPLSLHSGSNCYMRAISIYYCWAPTRPQTVVPTHRSTFAVYSSHYLWERRAHPSRELKLKTRQGKINIYSWYRIIRSLMNQKHRVSLINKNHPLCACV